MASSTESFEVLNVPDLVVNIWLCTEHLKTGTRKGKNHSRIEIFCELCVESLKTRWQSEWGNFDEITSKILKNDKNFVNDLTVK